MIYKLFGKNIAPDCSYCAHGTTQNGRLVCVKSKVLSDGKCRSFSSDPLLRVPLSVSLSGNFTPEDFQL